MEQEPKPKKEFLKDYRDNLANDLREMRNQGDKESAERLLESEKETEEYRESKNLIEEERKELMKERYNDFIEKTDIKKYRKDLAKDLKNIRSDGDLEGAKRVLETEKQKLEYRLSERYEKDFKRFKERLKNEFGLKPLYEGKEYYGYTNTYIESVVVAFKDKRVFIRGFEVPDGDFDLAGRIIENLDKLTKKIKELDPDSSIFFNKGLISEIRIKPYTYYDIHMMDINSIIEKIVSNFEKRKKLENFVSPIIWDNLDNVAIEEYNYSPRHGSGGFEHQEIFYLKNGYYFYQDGSGLEYDPNALDNLKGEEMRQLDGRKEAEKIYGHGRLPEHVIRQYYSTSFYYYNKNDGPEKVREKLENIISKVKDDLLKDLAHKLAVKIPNDEIRKNAVVEFGRKLDTMKDVTDVSVELINPPEDPIFDEIRPPVDTLGVPAKKYAVFFNVDDLDRRPALDELFGKGIIPNGFIGEIDIYKYENVNKNGSLAEMVYPNNESRNYKFYTKDGRRIILNSEAKKNRNGVDMITEDGEILRHFGISWSDYYGINKLGDPFSIKATGY